MFVVVDANRIYSCLLSKGGVFRAIFLNSLSKRYSFVAPAFIFFEIGKHLDDIASRTKLTKEELSEVFSFVKEQVEIVPFEEFNMHSNKAETLAPHEKDMQY